MISFGRGFYTWHKEKMEHQSVSQCDSTLSNPHLCLSNQTPNQAELVAPNIKAVWWWESLPPPQLESRYPHYPHLILHWLLHMGKYDVTRVAHTGRLTCLLRFLFSSSSWVTLSLSLLCRFSWSAWCFSTLVSLSLHLSNCLLNVWLSCLNCLFSVLIIIHIEKANQWQIQWEKTVDRKTQISTENTVTVSWTYFPYLKLSSLWLRWMSCSLLQKWRCQVKMSLLSLTYSFILMIDCNLRQVSVVSNNYTESYHWLPSNLLYQIMTYQKMEPISLRF